MSDKPKPDHLYILLQQKDPRFRYGLSVFIEMMDYKKWTIERALKARRAKPGKR